MFVAATSELLLYFVVEKFVETVLYLAVARIVVRLVVEEQFVAMSFVAELSVIEKSLVVVEEIFECLELFLPSEHQYLSKNNKLRRLAFH